ncbi:hypothetical protein NON20_24640 (plasmid) [Synechocystis sp. B12]|nr:hypothetical protein NON20_24640 [Synechocystis sp. B12]
MKYKILSSLALVTLGITALAPGAFANPTVGRETRTGDIYVSGLGSYQSIKGEYSSLPRSTNKNANECGVIKLSGSSASLPINAGDTQLGQIAFTVPFPKIDLLIYEPRYP